MGYAVERLQIEEDSHGPRPTPHDIQLNIEAFQARAEFWNPGGQDKMACTWIHRLPAFLKEKHYIQPNDPMLKPSSRHHHLATDRTWQIRQAIDAVRLL